MKHCFPANIKYLRTRNNFIPPSVEDKVKQNKRMDTIVHVLFATITFPRAEKASYEKKQASLF